MLSARPRVAAAAGAHRARPPAARLRIDALPPRSPPVREGRRTPQARPRRSPRRSRRCASTSARRRRRVNLLDPDDRPRPLLRRLHRQVQPRPPARRARPAGADRYRRPVGSLPADWREQSVLRGLDGPAGPVEVAFGRAPRRARGQPRDTLHRHDVVDGARRGAPGAGSTGAVPVPDPGVRAVHVPGGHLRRARASSPTDFPPRAVLDRAPARLLPPPLDRRLRGGEGRERRAPSFQNAITPVAPPTAEHCAGRPRRLLFYARPEAHAARNMFELGVLALARAARDGASAATGAPRLGSVAPPSGSRSGRPSSSSCSRAPSSATTLSCSPSTTSGWR